MKRLYSILTLFLASLGTVVVAQNPVLYTQGDLVTSAEDLTNGKYFISVASKGIEGFIQYYNVPNNQNSNLFGVMKNVQSFPHGTTDDRYLYEVIRIDEENEENDGIRFYLKNCSSNTYLPIRGHAHVGQGNLQAGANDENDAARLTLGEIPFGNFMNREGYWLVYAPGLYKADSPENGISYLSNNGENYDIQRLNWWDYDPTKFAAGTDDLAAIAFYKAIEEESLSIQSAADLTTGYYVLDVLTSGTNGFMYYDKNGGKDANFRVRTGTSISNVLHDPNYYWKVEKSTDGTFTLQHISTKVYLSNVGLMIRNPNPNGNNNLIDPTDENYKPAVLRIDNTEENIYTTEDGEVRFGVYETTLPGSKYRYLHTNAGDNNSRIVSYHDSYSKDNTATAQKIAFYRVKALPEDGMAYRLHNVRPESNDESQTDNGYLLVDNGNERLGIVEYTDDNKDNMNAIFVCHKVGDKYIFTNGEKGDYLALEGSNSRYDSESNDFTLTSNASDKVGTFTLGIQKSGEETNKTIAISKENETASLTTHENGVIYDETTSNLFVLEPVDYPYNNVTLRTPTSQADGENYNYATIFLPFATTIPAGVEAYTATLEGDRLKLHAVSETLPANTAVVLRSTETTEALFVPATTAGDEIEDNVLEGTINTEVATPKNTYVLNGNFAAGIGFYSYIAESLPAGKAYLVAADVSEVEGAGVKGLLFGGQTATAIDSATAEGNVADDAPCYDLSGRRVAAPAKGIYIRGGKKVFIK